MAAVALLGTESGLLALLYLFLVREEQTRKPDGDQLETLRSGAFQNWYSAERAKADIKRDSGTPTS